jgi:lipopolysaccharide biosynthesis regulator YciM
VARITTDADERASALTSVAEALSKAGKEDKVIEIAYAATEAALSVSASDDRARALAHVAQALARAGQVDKAAELAHTAAEVARTTNNPQWRALALKDVAHALVEAGKTDEATHLAHTITEPSERAAALAYGARCYAGSPEGGALLAWALSLDSLSALAGDLATVAPDALDEAVRRVRQSL